MPNQRLRHTDQFDDANLPGEFFTTVALAVVSFGTELSVLQEALPELIPVEGCYPGWQQSLALLADLVKAEVAG